jgi:outer membrane receptor protein involved in Fe transport
MSTFPYLVDRLRGAHALARISILLLLAVVTPSVALAQDVGRIEGRVSGPGGPVSDVSILIPSARRTAFTDLQGRFRIEGVRPGEHTLTVQRIGLATVTRTVTVAAGQTVTADFQMTEAAEMIDPLVVTATSELQRRNDASATIAQLDGAEVRRTRAAHPAGLMNRLAGVHVSELSGEGHSMAMRQPITTKPVYLYLEDGVPTRATGFFNHNALYEVNIPQSAGVEVIKGPGTALYGSDAIGGVVNVLTREAPASPTADLVMEGGTNSYLRALATAGFTQGAHGIRADLNVTRSDTWRPESPFTRKSGTLRWDVTGGSWTAKTVLTGSTVDQVDAPSVSAQQFEANPRLNRAPIAYRRVRALRLSTAFERESGASLFSITPFGRINRMDLLPSWQLTFDPQTWETDNNSVGVIARYRRDFEPMRTRVILGVDTDLSPGRFFAQQAVVTAQGTGGDRIWNEYQPGEVHYDYDVTYRQVSPYVHTEFSPVPRMRVDVGVRYDASGYVYDSNLEPLATGAHRRPADTTVTYSRVSPKVGASFTFGNWLNTFASYRQGFRAPSQGQLFQQNTALNSVGLQPVKVDSREVGARGQIGTRAVYQVSAYTMDVRDDIITFVTAQNTREARNAGKTRHRGVEASLGVALLPELRLDAAYSRASHTYLDWRPQDARPGVAEIDYSGNDMEQAPGELANVMLTYSPALLNGGRLAVEYSTLGRYAADAANQFYYDGYQVINLHANVFLLGRAELFARVTNLADKKFAELVNFDPFQRDNYTPGGPRLIYMGLRYAFQ